MQFVASQESGAFDVSTALPARVLIAEDEHLVATELARQVNSLDVKVVGPVSCGQDAIELARSGAADLALLDIRMGDGDGDGLDAAQTLQLELGIPVVLVSAYSDDAYVRRGAEVGVFGYLLKPVSTDQLRVAIAVAWAAHNERRRLGDEVGELRSALADRKVIERAKGLLMEKGALSEPDAMRLLQRQARNTRRRLADVAKSVIDTGELLEPSDSQTQSEPESD